jgi:hypothetical protein
MSPDLKQKLDEVIRLQLESKADIEAMGAMMVALAKELLILRKIVLDLDETFDRQLWDDGHVKSCRDAGIDVAPDCEHHVVITETMRCRVGNAVADMRAIPNET